MEWDITNVQVTGPHSLFVQFRDGVRGEMKFEPSFFRSVFAPLIDPQVFAAVRMEDGVVTWQGELDLAPDAMHDEIKRNGCWIVA